MTNSITAARRKGGLNSLIKRNAKREKNFSVDINDPKFCEFYGALLGDGWLSVLSYQYKYKKNLWWVGISGHAELDFDYLTYLSDIIEELFGKKPNIKLKKNSKAMEIIFCHRPLILFLNEKLGFPIGKKINLAISDKLIVNRNNFKHILRGIFDTDGSVYLSRGGEQSRYKYPVIEICMKQEFLLDQINKFLIEEGYKPQRSRNKVKLKGYKQLNKWLDEIGTSNIKHFIKLNNFLPDKPK